MKKTIILANDITELTPDFLRAQGVRAVLSDLDNTLAGYGAGVPDQAAGHWMAGIKSAGISLFIISNAGKPRVSSFCDPLGLPYLARAKKPGAKGLLQALERLGVSASEAVMVGDQYRTDIRAGWNAGIRVILVPPRVKGFFFTLRRLLEEPFIRRRI